MYPSGKVLGAWRVKVCGFRVHRRHATLSLLVFFYSSFCFLAFFLSLFMVCCADWNGKLTFVRVFSSCRSTDVSWKRRERSVAGETHAGRGVGAYVDA